MDNQPQQPSGRTQPGDGAPAHLSVEAARPIETQSGEAAAERAASAPLTIDEAFAIIQDALMDGHPNPEGFLEYLYSQSNERVIAYAEKVRSHMQSRG